MRFRNTLTVMMWMILVTVGTARYDTAKASLPKVIETASFNAAYVQEDRTLPLRGAGLFRYLVWIKAYAGALYAPPEASADAILDDIPKRLEIAYFHPIKSEDFGSATLEGIRRNVSPHLLSRLRGEIARLNALYRDVEPGDRYSLTYWPGRGTTLELNGRVLGTIEGAGFAAAVFSIWLGPDPINPGFKRSLLGAK